MQILIIRNNEVPRMYDVVLADFDGEASKYLEKFLDFDTAVEIQKEHNTLYNVSAQENFTLD